MLIMEYPFKLPQKCKCSPFYLQPKKKFNDNVCYKNGPARVNQLCDVVKKMHTNTGLPGFLHTLHKAFIKVNCGNKII